MDNEKKQVKGSGLSFDAPSPQEVIPAEEYAKRKGEKELPTSNAGNSPEKETVEIDKDVLASLIAKISGGGNNSSAELAKAINKLNSSLSNSSVVDNSVGLGAPLLSDSEIDPDDFSDEPIVFFSFSITDTIFDDYFLGVRKNAPYNKAIKFRNYYRKPVPGYGKLNQVFNSMSIHVTHSKKVAEFLRGHSKFNVTIFNDIKDRKKLDTVMVDALTQASSEVRKYNPSKLRQECLANNINVDTSDLQILAQRLIQKKAKVSVEKYKSSPSAVNQMIATKGEASVPSGNY